MKLWINLLVPILLGQTKHNIFQSSQLYWPKAQVHSNFVDCLDITSLVPVCRNVITFCEHTLNEWSLKVIGKGVTILSWQPCLLPCVCVFPVCFPPVSLPLSVLCMWAWSSFPKGSSQVNPLCNQLPLKPLDSLLLVTRFFCQSMWLFTSWLACVFLQCASVISLCS